jgi:protein-S-isoprenylcysteine O-methyltransferase Ste14
LRRGLELRIPPVLAVFLTAGLMWLASRAVPALGFSIPGRGLFSAVFAVVGLIVGFLGVAAFRRVGTTVDPRKPQASTTLVRTGIYSRTRNPMYVGFLALLAAWASFLSNALAFAFLPGFVVYMNRFQIDAEERALASRFGRDFADYKARVRRWI